MFLKLAEYCLSAMATITESARALPCFAAVEAHATSLGTTVASPDFPAKADAADELRPFREKFLFPAADAAGRPSVYLCGNSLGLQPASTKQAVLADLDRWAALGVEGHFEDEPGRPNPGVAWWTIEDLAEAEAARLVGAEPGEVVIMNSLTVNLHLLLGAFYRPDGEREVVVVEDMAFPSDEYAVQSVVRHHGRDPAACIVRVPHGADFAAAVAELGDRCCVVLVGALQYYSGEWYDAKALADAAHGAGAVLGLDCAHAAGNVPLALHADGVDFACWCSYKYLNSGPGALAGAFVHAKHDTRTLDGALRGWWGNERSSRFRMAREPEFRAGAPGLQLSNPPTLPMVALKEAYALHDAATMAKLRAKSLALTGYLEVLLAQLLPPGSHDQVTPRDPARRGAQLSLLFAPPTDVDAVFAELRKRNVFVDLRRPNVIRVAPAPLYSGFADVRAFVDCLAEALAAQKT